MHSVFKTNNHNDMIRTKKYYLLFNIIAWCDYSYFSTNTLPCQKRVLLIYTAIICFLYDTATFSLLPIGQVSLSYKKKHKYVCTQSLWKFLYIHYTFTRLLLLQVVMLIQLNWLFFQRIGKFHSQFQYIKTIQCFYF